MGEILKQLDGVIALWLPLGVQLNVPYSDLQVISCNHRGDARRCMMEMIQSWLNNTLDPKWSTIVQALAKIGHKRLAHKIALNYGMNYLFTYEDEREQCRGMKERWRVDQRKDRRERKGRSYDITLSHVHFCFQV